MIADVPGIQIDSVTIEGGMMMSEDYELVWGEDPEAANRAITECMGTATAAVRLAVDNLKKQSLGSQPSGL